MTARPASSLPDPDPELVERVRLLRAQMRSERRRGLEEDLDALTERVRRRRAALQAEATGPGFAGKVAQGLTGLALGTLDTAVGIGTTVRRAGHRLRKAAGFDRPAPWEPEGTPNEPIPGPGRLERAARFQRELIADSAPEPEGLGDVVARGVGYMASQGPAYAGGGAAIRGAAGLKRAAELPATASRPARAGRGLLEAAKDALAVAPIDIASTVEGPEYSSAGAFGELFNNDRLRAIAEDPAERAAFESAFGFTADVALRTLHAGGAGALRRLLATVDVTPEVTRGLQEGMAEAGARPEWTPPPYRDPIQPARPGSGIEAARRALEDQGPVEGLSGFDMDREAQRLQLERDLQGPLELEDPAPRSPLAAAARAVDDRGAIPGVERHIAGESEQERLERLAAEYNRQAAERRAAAPPPPPGPELDLGPSRGELLREQVAQAPQEFDAPPELLDRLYDVDERISRLSTEATEADLERLLDEKDEILLGMARDREARGAARRPTERASPASNEMGGASIAATGRLAAGAGGALVGAGADEESPERGAVLGGLAGLGTASGAAASVRALRPKVKAPTALETRHLADPSVRRVAESVGQGPAKTLAPRGVIERAKAVARWLRYKGVRETLPMEALEKDLTDGASTELRDELARARGWLPAATLHLEETFRSVLQSAEEAPSLARALGKAERGLELAAAGKDTTPQQLQDWQDTVARLGAIPEVRAAVDELRAYYDALLQMKEDVGLLSPEQAQAIRAAGQKYIPFLPSEVAEALPSTPGRQSRYSPNRGTGVRKMSEALNEAVTVDPWDQAIVDTYETFDKVARQRVANTIAELVEAHPSDLIERLPGRPERTPTDGRLIEARVDGEMRYYLVHNKDLADSWLNFNKPIRSSLLRAANGMRRFFQGGITGTPVFALVNGMRDFMASAVQYYPRGVVASGAVGAGAGAVLNEDRTEGALKGAALGLSLRGGLHLSEHLLRTGSALNDILGPETLGAIVGGTGSYLTADEDENSFARFLMGAGAGAALGKGARAVGLGGNRAVYGEFIREGGGGFGFYAKNMTDARKMREQLLKEGISAEDFVNPKSWWDAVQYVSRAIETAPRLARYKTLRAAGEGVGPSIFSARDLSLDFSVKPGSQIAKGLTESVPFLNPSIQGMDKLARLLTNPKTWPTAAATIMAPTVVLWGMIHEDEETAAEYQSRPLWERNTYWLVPKKWLGGESGFIRVPKPFELGLIYASMPERVLDYGQMQDPEALQFAFRDMWGQYGPGNVDFTPMPVGPILDVTRSEHGWDPFRRREIDPHSFDMQSVPPELQYDDRTSSLAVALGRALDRSPAKIDYLIRGYTGSIGSELLDWTSRGARAAGWDDRPEPLLRERPFTSRFHTDPAVTPEPELTLRRKWKRAEEAYQGAKRLLDEGDIQGARSFAREHRSDLVAYYQLKPRKDLVDRVAKVRRQVRESRAPSPKKREALTKLNRGLVARLGEAVDR